MKASQEAIQNKNIYKWKAFMISWGCCINIRQVSKLIEMVQKIFGLGIGATGIVGTLIISGILLQVFKVSPATGDLAVKSGVGIGILVGLLAIFSLARRVIR